MNSCKPESPILRFPEFKDPWTEQRLGPFVHEHKEKSKVLNQHRVMTSSNKGLMWQDEYYGGGRIVDRDNIGFNVIPPDFITFRSRADNRNFTFNINELKETGLISIFYPVFTTRKVSPQFIVTLLNNKKHYVGRHSVGTSQTVLSLNELRRLKLLLPTLPEQRKIADFLTAVDGRIGQLSQKKALLEDYKKGVMQQLFTQALRFKDDHGNDFHVWEEKTLGAIAAFSKGRGISKADVHEDGALPCIRYGELYTHYAELIRDVKSRTNVPEKELVLSQRNDVIIPASGETHIDISTASCVTLDGVALGGDLNIIRTKQNGIFLAYYLNNACKHAIAGMAQGSSVIHLYPDQLKRLRLHLPSVKEQTKIANFLSALDRKIESVAQQISHTQAFKKGLLQQMFV